MPKLASNAATSTISICSCRSCIAPSVHVVCITFQHKPVAFFLFSRYPKCNVDIFAFDLRFLTPLRPIQHRYLGKPPAKSLLVISLLLCPLILKRCYPSIQTFGPSALTSL